VNELQIVGAMVGEVMVATLSGDVDLIESDRASEELTELARCSGVGMILDLNGVNYVDSSGVRMLFALARQMEVARRELAFVIADTSPLCRLFKVTGLDELVPTEASLPDALTRLRGATSRPD
jgi:anti-anti-sigma factor